MEDFDATAHYHVGKIREHADALIELLDEPPLVKGIELDVPYLSQWGAGANVRTGDCGPACVAMLAHYLTAFRPSVDQAADACGQPATAPGSHYTNHAQLIQGASTYGFALATRSKYRPPALTPDIIKKELHDDQPVIVLVHYGVLRDGTNGTPHAKNQDQKYGRGHWMLVVGYDDEGYAVNDPDFWGARAADGDHRWVPAKAFEDALATVAPGCSVGHQGLVVG